MQRDIIIIDREACTGCGQCVNACVGGALELVDGKAFLAREDHCDGLGVCVGECPAGALHLERRTVEPAIPVDHVRPEPEFDVNNSRGHACPGAMARSLKDGLPPADVSTPPVEQQASALADWPIQLHLVNPAAPHFQNADILLAASCSAFSFGGFHAGLLAGRSLIIACPKLDNTSGYVEKIAMIFQRARPKTLTVARMEVPCCGGLCHWVREARAISGENVPAREHILKIGGGFLAERSI